MLTDIDKVVIDRDFFNSFMRLDLKNIRKGKGRVEQFLKWQSIYGGYISVPNEYTIFELLDFMETVQIELNDICKKLSKLSPTNAIPHEIIDLLLDFYKKNFEFYFDENSQQVSMREIDNRYLTIYDIRGYCLREILKAHKISHLGQCEQCGCFYISKRTATKVCSASCRTKKASDKKIGKEN